MHVFKLAGLNLTVSGPTLESQTEKVMVLRPLRVRMCVTPPGQSPRLAAAATGPGGLSCSEEGQVRLYQSSDLLLRVLLRKETEQHRGAAGPRGEIGTQSKRV